MSITLGPPDTGADGMPLPLKRARRIRSSEPLRGLLAEHRVSVHDLIEPLIVVPGRAVRNEIASMPGVWRQSVDQLVEDAKAAADLGIPAVLLFGVPERKDEQATTLSDPAGPVQRAIESLKKALPDLIVIADLCACEYTSHGHCGIVDERGYLDNDRTLALLAQGALSYARAGVDVIAPSDMMDGRVAALRHALDVHGFSRTAILSYAVKYASAWYGPFREAVDSTPSFGDRRTHQMDPANVREGLKEALQDVEEGADMLIVKPGMPYLDVLWRVREAVNVPLAAYNVSGEYAMVKAGSAKGWLDEPRIVDEMLVGFKRAGADCIITYFARDFARRQHAARRAR